jgi:hypothetical protein
VNTCFITCKYSLKKYRCNVSAAYEVRAPLQLQIEHIAFLSEKRANIWIEILSSETSNITVVNYQSFGLKKLLLCSISVPEGGSVECLQGEG